MPSILFNYSIYCTSKAHVFSLLVAGGDLGELGILDKRGIWGELFVGEVVDVPAES